MKKTGYVSDFTKFIDKYKTDHPHTKEKQHKLRATWWDKSVDEVEFEQQLLRTDLHDDGYKYFTYK